MTWLKLTSVALSFLLIGAQGRAHYEWPAVRSLEQTFDFTDASQARLELPILGESNKPLYVLLCIGKGLFHTDRHFDHSGDFECRLNSTYSQDHYSTLLTYDPVQERDWESRGRFLWPEVLGSCGRYPEYGRIRNFRLRGMQLTLEIANTPPVPTATAPDEIKSFRLRGQVQPDPTAYSTIAAPVPFDESDVPRNRCDEVRAKHVRGIVTREFVKQSGLTPPFPPVVHAQKKSILPGQNTHFDFADKPLALGSRGFDLAVFDTDGHVGYRFECSTTEPIMRWGVSCGLFETGRKINLLSDSTDAYSGMDRATVLPEQINGKCADYPDWGAERIFRLRGLRLTLHMKDPAFVPSDWDRGGQGMEKVEIAVDVTPDASASSPVAAPPQYADWEAFPEANACENRILNPGSLADAKPREANTGRQRPRRTSHLISEQQ
jgi:hypothetical protein